MEQEAGVGGENFPYWLITSRLVAFLSVVILILPFILQFSTNAKDRVPTVGIRWRIEPSIVSRIRFVRNASKILAEGYSKYSREVFKIRSFQRDIYVVPFDQLEKFCSLSDTILSLRPVLLDVRLLWNWPYNNVEIGMKGDPYLGVLQKRLKPGQEAISSTVWDEARYGFNLEFQTDVEEWRGVEAFHSFERLFTRIVTRLLVGKSLCRNDKFLDVMRRFNDHTQMTAVLVGVVPWFFRPFLAPFLPSFWLSRWDSLVTQKHLVPLILERLDNEKSGWGIRDKPDDFIQWMLDLGESEDREPRKLAHCVLMMALAAIHTTSMAAMHTILDICARPELIGTLREEIEKVLKQEGGWQKTTASRLSKLDSVMKESQRLNPPGILSFRRKVLHPILMADGTQLARGSTIALASEPLNLSPHIYPNPDVFDGLRHYRLQRQNAGSDLRGSYQFTSINKTSVNFGYGRHSCPGRYLASEMIKVAVAMILLECDIKFEEGKDRPKNIKLDTFIAPDHSARLLIRRRRT